MAFLGEIGAYVKEKSADEKMKPLVTSLGTGASHLQQASMWFMQNAMAKPDNAGAGATDYMHMFGLVALGYMWCKIADAAQAKIGTGADPRFAAKLVTAKFFMERMMPETAAHLARIQAGAGAVMELPAEAF